MAQIDSLDIQIQASAESAASAINKLIAKLNVLEMHMNRVNGSKFGKQMESAAKAMDKMSATAAASSKGMDAIASGTAKASLSMKAMPGAVNAFSSSISRAEKHTMSLAKVFGLLNANFWWIRRLFQKGLGAIEISSDLTEVQNVVDVTFGNMAYKLDEFAKTSRQAFGLSELSMKTYASQFQAMFTAMGMSVEQVAEVHERLAKNEDQMNYAISKGYKMSADSLSDMSINLTKLAADMGSFYNQNPEDVAKRLQAGVVSGQSRALRQYGLDLTMATLQEYAHSQGINAKVQSMTQAEKTMLRYQYVMDNMTMVMGDFTRTSMTWANQVKLLKQNFQALGAVIGRALVGWIKPAIVAINGAMNTIIALVEKAVNAIGKLMGWQVEISGVSADFAAGVDEAVGGLEDAAGGADDTAGGLGKANKAAKELKKTILGFDELNVLNGANNDANDGGSGGGSGGGAGGASGGSGGGMFGPVSGGELTKYKSDIGSWFELGKRIGDTLSQAMERIDWGKIYEKARRFGTGLADFLNGLISPRLFGNLGKTIAGALNTALEFLNSFGARFSWKNFGESIAEGINRFFNNFNFELLASTINRFAHGLLDTIIAAIKRTDWEMVGNQIGRLLLSIDVIGIGKKFAKAVWAAINSGFKAYRRMFKTAPVESAILGIIGITKLFKLDAFKKLAVIFGKVVVSFGTLATSVSKHKGVLTSVGLAFPKLSGAVTALRQAFIAFHYVLQISGSLLQGFNAVLVTIGANMSPTAKAVMGIVAVFTEFSAFHNAFANMTKGTETLKENVLGLAAAFTSASLAFGVLLGSLTGGLLAGAAVAVVAAIKGIHDAMNEIRAEEVGSAIYSALVTPNGVPIYDVSQMYSETITAIGDSFDAMAEHAKSIESANEHIRTTSNEISNVQRAMELGVVSTEDGVERLKNAFAELSSTTKTKMDEVELYLTEAFGENSYLGRVFTELGVNLGNTRDAIIGTTERTKEEIGKLEAELSELYDKAARTEADNERIKEIQTLLLEYSNSKDEFTKIIDDLDSYVSGVDIDWGSVIDTEGKVDVEKFTSTFSNITNAVTDTNGKIDTAGQGIEESLNDLYDKAIKAGEYDYAKDLKIALDAMPDAIDLSKQDITDAAVRWGDEAQTSLIQKIGEVADAAERNWDEKGGIFGFASKDEYVSRAVQDFKTGSIDPVAQTIEDELEKLGIDGAGWAKDASKEILDSMFDTEEIIGTAEYGQQYVSGVSTKLKDNWREIFDDVSRSVTDESAIVGKALPEGTGKGISDNKQLAINEAKLMTKETLDAVKNEAQINSPSKVTEGYGANIVEGLILGIGNKMPTSIAKVKEWMLSVSKQLLNDISTLGKNALHDVSTNLKNVAAEARARVGDMQTWMSEGYNRIKQITTDTFDSIYRSINDKIESAKSVVSSGLNAIQGFFSSMRLEFPQIKMPHFEIGTQTKNFLGQDIILPRIDVQWYAKGGFPEDGLFFANHHELVGEFSNGRTAVANNAQIIEGIQSGVTRAIVQYLPDIIRNAVSDADTGGGDIYIGDEQIARAAQRGQRKMDKRFNPSIKYGA